MLLNVDGGIVVSVLLSLLLAYFAWLLSKLLLDPFGKMRVYVLGQVILAVETFTTLSTSVHFIRPMDDRMPL